MAIKFQQIKLYDLEANLSKYVSSCVSDDLFKHGLNLWTIMTDFPFENEEFYQTDLFSDFIEQEST